MSRTLQFRRYDNATVANTVGANGELIINTTNKTITVHDGVTPGGFATLNSVTDNNIDQFARNTANSATSNITILQGVNTTQNTNITNATNLAQAAFNAANTANGGGTITGNISISSTNSQINFVPNSSGDGFGYSTIELVPDTNATQDQYIIIDPTAPSHIHIRAGGQQDASASELYLGGEKNYVRVASGVRLQSEELDDTYYYYNDSVEFTLGSWYEDSGTYYVQYTTTNSSMQSRTFDFTNDTINNQLNVYHSGGSSNTLTSAGNASSLGGNVYRVSVNEAPPTNPLSLEAIEFRIFANRTSFIEIQNSDVEISADDDVRIYAQDLFALYNNSTVEPIEIITNYDNNQQRWTFNVNGTLTFPDASVQTGGSISIVELKALVANCATYGDFQTAIAAL
jgi:hypothetical protein